MIETKGRLWNGFLNYIHPGYKWTPAKSQMQVKFPQMLLIAI